MNHCPDCSHETLDGSRFCPNCGGVLASAALDATRTSVGDDVADPPRSTSKGASRDRFVPGDLLSGRYRVVALLGRGGMGEVYRADDLKLGQPVALKFLPAAVERDPSRLERLLQEVRIARQISHPNVCRVYDAGDVDGRHFLSMEYVDGEDLASLLRRIGHLPRDKAIELARQICAGLAAAHAQGILHRDLKPANVMIDGRGRAKVTDFGLAALATDVRGDEVRAGTPAYMAPEQRSGSAVSVQSDLFALGLVLYEMFTGREAFAASSIADLDRLQRDTTPTNPSNLVEGVDPAVERVILHCLENDPGQRPRSALAVALSLPGGDPLAAALAAGETPSPEMVAAAGGEGALAPGAALAWLAVLLLAIGLYGALCTKTSLVSVARAEKPPEVLVERARAITRRFGHVEPARDEAYGFLRNAAAIGWVATSEPGPTRWGRLAGHQPPALLFWYRESPRPLVAESVSGKVSYFDPPPLVSGMTWVQTDSLGRLVSFLAAAPQIEAEPRPATEPDWNAAFSEAGLEMAAFAPAEPLWVPLTYADVRRAWIGSLPGRSGTEFRLEAAAYRGRVTYVTLVGPWSRPGRMTTTRSGEFHLGWFLYLIFTGAAAAIAIFLARGNVRAGRGDRKGAFRLAMYLLVAQLVVWALSAHHVADLSEESGSLVRATASSLYAAALGWIMYLALEPFVRRRWPESIIGWTRLLAGRIRDPRIGREILIGSAIGAALGVAMQAYHYLAQAQGAPSPAPLSTHLDLLLGPRQAASAFLSAQLAAMNFGIFLFFFLFMGIAWTRVRWPGVVAFTGISAFMSFLFLGSGPTLLRLVACLVWGLLITALFLRAGLLGAMAGLLTGNSGLPLWLEPSEWYAGATIVIWIAIAAAGVYGFRIALAGRPVLGRGPEPGPSRT